MLVENYSAFFRDFGVVATLGTAEVRGIFDNAFVDAGGIGAFATQPTFTCASADLAGVHVGAPAVVRSTSFRIVGIEPDGTGISFVRLERQ